MAILIHHLALVSESTLISQSDLSKVSAALQKQVTRDLGPIWELSATVDAFPTLQDVPTGYWTMIVKDDIGTPGAAGVHEDQNGQPFALITASQNLDEWSLTASHEALEMLVDPSGNRLVAGDSPMTGQGRVNFLVEVCDPAEASNFAYSVNGILVSDFYTPNYFDPVRSSGVRYSYTGALDEPRQVLNGGYLSWIDPSSNTWWQEVWFDGETPTFRNLGPLQQRAGSLRASVDSISGAETRRAVARGRARARGAGLPSGVVAAASRANAATLRELVDRLTVSTDGGESEGSAGTGRRPVPRTRA